MSNPTEIHLVVEIDAHRLVRKNLDTKSLDDIVPAFLSRANADTCKDKQPNPHELKVVTLRIADA